MTPQVYDDDRIFNDLKSSYTQWWDYGFDDYNKWSRGIERTVDLLKLEELRRPGLSIFEAACGDGMTGCALAGYGHNVVLNDLEDWRDTRATSLTFVKGDICQSLPLKSEFYDLVISYNFFEHVYDPVTALNELVRMCNKNGYIYLFFDPLYSSPLGLHAFCFTIPYPQFLFSSEFIEAKVRQCGVYDLAKTSYDLQPTNKWRLSQFIALFENCGCDIVFINKTLDFRFLNIIDNFPRAFTGRGMTLDDVTTNGISVMLKKRG